MKSIKGWKNIDEGIISNLAKLAKRRYSAVRQSKTVQNISTSKAGRVIGSAAKSAKEKYQGAKRGISSAVKKRRSQSQTQNRVLER